MNRFEAPKEYGIGYARDNRGVGAADPLVGLGLIPEPRITKYRKLGQNPRPDKVPVRVT
jgi:hypothetical protein